MMEKQGKQGKIMVKHERRAEEVLYMGQQKNIIMVEGRGAAKRWVL